MTQKSVAPGTKRTLRVAAVQVTSEDGKVAENLRHATGFVEEAAARGAKLILLPEFMPTGYLFTQEIWDAGEPREGPTVKWLKETSKRLGVWLGTSYLEAEGEDFYNTFVLTNPEGEEDGRVRKQTPATGEACFTRGEAGPHVINTKLGKVGVAICYENRFSYTPRNMYEQSVDLMLQPHAAIALKPDKILFPPKTAELINDFLHKVSSIYAGMLGIPVIYCNHSGQWRSAMPGLPFMKMDNPFYGFSSISDSDGTLKAQLGGEEGVIVEDVILDPSLKKKVPPRTYGKWSMPNVPSAVKTWSLLEAVYGVWYRSSKERKLRARKISPRH